MTEKIATKRRIIREIFTECIFVLFAYLIVYVYKFQGFVEYQYTGKIFTIIILCRLAISFVLKDLWNVNYNYFQGLFHIIKSAVYLAFSISLLIIWLDFYRLSRLLIFGTTIILFALDFIRYNFLYIKYHEKKSAGNHNKINYKKVIIYFFGDFIIWTISFLLIHKIGLRQFFNHESLQITFLIISGFWLISSFFTYKFTADFSGNYWYLISPQWKSVILIGTGITFYYVIFPTSLPYKQKVLPFLFVYFVSELICTYLYFLVFNVQKQRDLHPDIDCIGSMVEDDEIEDTKQYAIESLTKLVETKQVNNTIKTLQELIDFIATIPKLANVKSSNAMTFDTEHLFNIEGIDKHSLNLLINLHTINDFPLLNKYFLTIYSKLKPGGYFVSKIRTIEIHKDRFFKKFPKFISHLFYIFHYIFYRIFPYTPILDKIFLLITGGKRTVIAKAETLGRLYYCGFKVVSTHEIGDFLYIVSKKSTIPSLKDVPSVNLIIKLKRVGRNGNIFNLYKFRTMYPYSEFLQDYIYKLNSLDEGGKIQNDFRITGWGSILRKFWLDELPQIINYIKGDLALVGVRALSFHYFSLYPPNIKESRLKYKNGLFPPFYADMPKTFDEIIESEKNYFLQKEKKPFITDCKYLFKILKNIFIHGNRSK